VETQNVKMTTAPIRQDANERDDVDTSSIFDDARVILDIAQSEIQIFLLHLVPNIATLSVPQYPKAMQSFFRVFMFFVLITSFVNANRFSIFCKNKFF
jgi:hypothetical protein